jgi:pyrroloquinoline quinone biosynthesis protein B
VQVILLGTAAGGGFPQWNCWCPTCRIGRLDPRAAHPRTQSSAAVSADGVHWFLLNASPDVRDQVQRLISVAPAGSRHVPIEGVILTDAELDHSLGLVLLREGRALQVYATAAVERIVADDSRVLSVTRAFADVEVTRLEPGAATSLRRRDGAGAGLTVEPFTVVADAPRFASRTEPGHTVGLFITDSATGATCAYAPGCGGLDDALLGRLARCSLVLFDGTFWANDELVALGISERTALQLDHLPISGRDGSLERLRTVPASRVVYVHINNTNPVLLEDSAERRAVEAAGITVGMDGMRFDL